MNLLAETIESLASSGKTPADVRWIGSLDRWFTWDEFASIADVEYDPGFGIAKVDERLVVVGDDWWLERGEYDGSEWWEFKKLPIRPDRHAAPVSVVGNHDDDDDD